MSQSSLVAMESVGAQRATATWENGSLAPLDHLRSERADSPTPGLVEGTEPGETTLQHLKISLFFHFYLYLR